MKNLQLNYDELHIWADCRETHVDIVRAIFSIADNLQHADEIWENGYDSTHQSDQIEHIAIKMHKELHGSDACNELNWGQYTVSVC